MNRALFCILCSPFFLVLLGCSLHSTFEGTKSVHLCNLGNGFHYEIETIPNSDYRIAGYLDTDSLSLTESAKPLFVTPYYHTVDGDVDLTILCSQSASPFEVVIEQPEQPSFVFQDTDGEGGDLLYYFGTTGFTAYDSLPVFEYEERNGENHREPYRIRLFFELAEIPEARAIEIAAQFIPAEIPMLQGGKVEVIRDCGGRYRFYFPCCVCVSGNDPEKKYYTMQFSRNFDFNGAGYSPQPR